MLGLLIYLSDCCGCVSNKRIDNLLISAERMNMKRLIKKTIVIIVSLSVLLVAFPLNGFSQGLTTSEGISLRQLHWRKILKSRFSVDTQGQAVFMLDIMICPRLVHHPR